MTRFADFKTWLWSDWGKPNFLTRAGVPRIVTNFVAFLLAPLISFALTLRFAPETDKQNIRIFVHEPLFLLAYALLTVIFLAIRSLKSRPNLKTFRQTEGFSLSNKSRKNLMVKTFGLSF